MEFKVDENLPVEVADLLRQVGDDAVTVEVIDRLIPVLASEPLEHLLWIVEETRLRIRG